MLNYFYDGTVLKLDYTYQLNLAMYNSQKHPELNAMWRKVWPRARVIHYTILKPFKKEEGDGKYGPVMQVWRDVHQLAVN